MSKKFKINQILNTPNQYGLHGIPKAVVLHTTLGAYKGAVEWLMLPPEAKGGVYSSAHFVIGRLGQITQLAPLTAGTWHAGGVSRPSKRAKAILPNTLGRLKNPNRHTIGIEFASGWDIDKDGVIESWEKLYTPDQIKACSWLMLNVIEPALKKEFNDDAILTHKDIAIHKPDLEVQRSMVLAQIKKERIPTQPTPTTPICSLDNFTSKELLDEYIRRLVRT